ncbi:MAG: zinc metalloprotease [Streptosporangiaceae bacterium]
MKSAGKIAVLGLVTAATVSVPHARPTVPDAVAAAEAPRLCVGEPAGESAARVRAGGGATEPNGRVGARTAASVQRTVDRLANSPSGRSMSVDRETKAVVPKWINIPVWFHVIHNGKRGNLSRAAVNKQLTVLDDAYQGKFGGDNTYVNFSFKGLTRTRNAAWFGDPKRYAPTFKRKLHRGGDGTLNLYTADLGNELLGWATWPWDYKKAPKQDGVVVHYGSFPGGPIKNYNLGYTGAHETGHWLGLYHTFGADYPAVDGCAAGDKVADTPAEAEPASGCPVINPDTCPAAGDDPIHNYMDYAYDTCMDQFTVGQGNRMRVVWNHWRP